MIVLFLTILSIVAGLIALVFHIRALYYMKKYHKPDKNISNAFKIVTLLFLALSIFLVHNYTKTSRLLKLLNITLILIPITIIEFILFFI